MNIDFLIRRYNHLLLHLLSPNPISNSFHAYYFLSPEFRENSSLPAASLPLQPAANAPMPPAPISPSVAAFLNNCLNQNPADVLEDN
jgi:hypothetical protein